MQQPESITLEIGYSESKTIVAKTEREYQQKKKQLLSASGLTEADVTETVRIVGVITPCTMRELTK